MPELMDAPDLDEQIHRRALRGLKRINAISRSDAILWPVLKEFAQAKPTASLRVLDLACGGGDVACRLAMRARRAGLSIVIHGCDRSELAIRTSRELAAAHQLANVEFFPFDLQQDHLPGDYDVIMCSLFLHHLDETEVVDLLQRMAHAARISVLANDLRRTELGYLMAWVGCRLLSRSQVVHVDGPRSVAGAFSCDEILALAAQAGLHNAQLTRHWPQRFLLRWDRP